MKLSKTGQDIVLNLICNEITDLNNDVEKDKGYETTLWILHDVFLSKNDIEIHEAKDET